MSFNTNGFLGKEINSVMTDNHQNYRELFLFCEEINRYSQNIRYNLNVYSYDIKGIITACLFIRIQNAFQGSVIMYKYGMDTEAKVITRFALESLFYLKAIIKIEDFCKDFIYAYKKKREILLSKIIENKDDIFTELQKPSLQNEYKKLKEENKKNKYKKFSVIDIVKLTESYNEYYYPYSILCNEVHVDIRTLEKKYIITEDNEIKAINCFPSTNDIEMVLFTNCYVLLKALNCINEYFNLDLSNDITQFENKSEHLFKKDLTQKIK